ncbi:uncharacterized protein BJ171DRAFT_477829 [Polychytrium aggregatum]|uniref:uncharacterized protein n=1 Tax=Polychytrium aggregatum TaxID=110093 RepID=UPI0022FDB486|nr:uncharacterized protein BJ171DRAFT_477829 [Polychytrium aggregatum]KAI9197471.1 hypothetical protein BJ171DRAFT_477829 [Polychytrium aggregatum]
MDYHIGWCLVCEQQLKQRQPQPQPQPPQSQPQSPVRSSVLPLDRRSHRHRSVVLAARIPGFGLKHNQFVYCSQTCQHRDLYAAALLPPGPVMRPRALSSNAAYPTALPFHEPQKAIKRADAVHIPRQSSDRCDVDAALADHPHRRPAQQPNHGLSDDLPLGSLMGESAPIGSVHRLPSLSIHPTPPQMQETWPSSPPSSYKGMQEAPWLGDLATKLSLTPTASSTFFLSQSHFKRSFSMYDLGSICTLPVTDHCLKRYDSRPLKRHYHANSRSELDLAKRKFIPFSKLVTDDRLCVGGWS